MPSLTITNAVLVLPNRLIERGTLRVEQGRIAAIDEGPVSSLTEQADVIDAAGAFLIPGVVDLHNDNLEFEINPRPRANLPIPFALNTMERRLAAAGITTEFHAISFMEQPAKQRSVGHAEAKAAHIAAVQRGPVRAVRHHILHRLDVRSPQALDSAFASLRRSTLRYASLNDHTPGQGQYRNIERLIALAHENADRLGSARTDASWYRERMERARADTGTVPAFYERVYQESRATPTILSTHDDDTVEKVDAQVAIGATIAEFPVTFEAARHARDRGMTIVVGAPNIMRGGSQSGNLPAHELVALGLADAICADYHAPCLIPAAFKLARDGLLELPAAIRMITLNPARAVGLHDLGALEAGRIADLALVRLDADGLTHVEATWIAGRTVFRFAESEWKPVPNGQVCDQERMA